MTEDDGMKYTKEYIAKVRLCSNLLDPPASEVIGELLDEIERLTAFVGQSGGGEVTDATEAIAFIRLCGALGISTDKYDFVTAVLLAATRIERLEAKIPKLNVDLAEASMHAYDGEVARMKLTAERDDWKADAERLIQLANFNNARAGEYFDLHEQLVKKYEVKE